MKNWIVDKENVGVYRNKQNNVEVTQEAFDDHVRDLPVPEGGNWSDEEREKILDKLSKKATKKGKK